MTVWFCKLIHTMCSQYEHDVLLQLQLRHLSSTAVTSPVTTCLFHLLQYHTALLAHAHTRKVCAYCTRHDGLSFWQNINHLLDVLRKFPSLPVFSYILYSCAAHGTRLRCYIGGYVLYSCKYFMQWQLKKKDVMKTVAKHRAIQITFGQPSPATCWITLVLHVRVPHCFHVLPDSFYVFDGQIANLRGMGLVSDAIDI
jgi:hypothetical protein